MLQKIKERNFTIHEFQKFHNFLQTQERFLGKFIEPGLNKYKFQNGFVLLKEINPLCMKAEVFLEIKEMNISEIEN